MRVLGIMSGTSLDSVDYALCSISDAGKIRCEEHWQAPFNKELKKALQRAASDQSSSWELAELHHSLGRFYASSAAGARVQLAGLHGQTVYHRPRRATGATLQIGEPAWLAEKLGVPVVSNFRAADIAAGGQGAPLATMFHQHVFARKGAHVAVNNLGGISNVTSLDWRRGRQPSILAFDTGPANMLLDLAVRHLTAGRKSFDRDGALASKGVIHERALAKWLKHDYFEAPPPKSTGRELFGEEFLKKVLAAGLETSDLAATLAEFTARSIALNYRLHLPTFPDEVILCGGGAANPFLFARIAAALREARSDVRIRGSHELGWDPQVIEASAFALLAWLTWHQRPGNLPQTTGAAGPRVLGQITFCAPRRSH